MSLDPAIPEWMAIINLAKARKHPVDEPKLELQVITDKTKKKTTRVASTSAAGYRHVFECL